MVERKKNPFLPERQGIRWRAGAAKGTTGMPPIPQKPLLRAETLDAPAPEYKRSQRGRKPKDRSIKPKAPEPIHADGPKPTKRRLFPDAGLLRPYFGRFDMNANAGWGTATDLVAVAHGPVGCGYFTQAGRAAPPGRIQGIENFSEHHFTTALDWSDLRDQGGDKKLSRALQEIDELFPLARGSLILSEDPIGLVESDIQTVARARNETTDKFTIALSTENHCPEGAVLTVRQRLAAFRLAAIRSPVETSTPYDVALTFWRRQTGLSWIIARLLAELGLNVIHQFTGTSVAEIGRVTRCRLAIGFAPMLDVPYEHLATGAARMLEKTFGIPVQWACFAGPSATDASLRAIAANFDWKVMDRAERIIADNRKKVEAIVAHYRPRLQGKLVAHFFPMTDEELEPYRLLGFRIGNASGWTGKTGKWRTPRIVCDSDEPSDKAMDSYIAEAKPDLVIAYGRDEYEWRKRGQKILPRTLFCDPPENTYWAYDGFARFAEALDHQLNAPWLKLIKSPWATGGG